MTHKERAKEYQKHLEKRCVVGQSCLGPLDPDHFKTLGSGGSDCSENIMTLCRKHHNEKGQLGVITFVNRYWRVKAWLIEKGWEFDEYARKWLFRKK